MQPQELQTVTDVELDGQYIEIRICYIYSELFSNQYVSEPHWLS